MNSDLYLDALDSDAEDSVLVLDLVAQDLVLVLDSEVLDSNSTILN